MDELYLDQLQILFTNIHVNVRCRRKEERSKHSHANNKAKQHSTPKNELPRVGCTVHVQVNIALGVLCCFALFVCLTLLAAFFHLSFKNMHIYTW